MRHPSAGEQHQATSPSAAPHTRQTRVTASTNTSTDGRCTVRNRTGPAGTRRTAADGQRRGTQRPAPGASSRVDTASWPGADGDAAPSTDPPDTPHGEETRSSDELRERTERMLRELAGLHRGTPEYSRLRNEIVELNMNLVLRVAGRYWRRRELRDDLRQVGAIGLIKAIDRYRPDRGSGFLAFAMPTISGEVKRYFRDTTWGLHVRRGEQERYLSVIRARDEMTAELEREPTVNELAERLDLPREEVEGGLATAEAHHVSSLDRPLQPGTEATYADLHGGDDPALELTENLTALGPLIAGLTDRERRILALRFWGDLTQAEIGEQLGLSQMHISRLLSRACARLREGLLAA